MYNTTQGPRGVVSVEKKTLIALTYMATQMSVRKIGDQFNVADSTALNSIEKFLAAVLMIKDHYIKWPSEEECVIIESQFKSLANFPGNLNTYLYNLYLKNRHNPGENVKSTSFISHGSGVQFFFFFFH
uniref:Nuclease HARBI1 n=1 Tax=Cacopsylla melanoneura TaxID=428564 RepID=A0A8D9F524_9HEMI